MNNSKYLINVVGPTAIGKTAMAVTLANYFATEIISADSRQFFKEMRIGTAVPSDEELKAAKHHFIQHLSVSDDYSVGDFERDAITTLDTLFKERNVVILAGGSGLYVDAVNKGLDDFPEVAPEIRVDLNTKSLTYLQDKLNELDPEYYEKVDVNNPHRLIRALEICIGTGTPYSSFLKDKKVASRNFKSIYIGLTAERAEIYDRINKRVDIMVADGLLEEVKQLVNLKDLNALQTVGYREIFDYLEGNITLPFAIEEIKKNTRRFAKRQLTWFRKNEEIVWFNYKTPVNEIIEVIKQTM